MKPYNYQTRYNLRHHWRMLRNRIRYSHESFIWLLAEIQNISNNRPQLRIDAIVNFGIRYEMPEDMSVTEWVTEMRRLDARPLSFMRGWHE